MTNAATQPNQVFTPRTVTSVERGASALVERFASPLRQIGGRALGFVDRLLGPRLFGLLADPTYREISVGNAPGMVFTVPWYRRSGAGVRQARPRPPAELATSPAAASAEAPAAGEIGPSFADAPSLTLDLLQSPSSSPDLSPDGEISPHQPASVHALASRAPSTGVHVIAGRSGDAAGEIVRGSEARLAEGRPTEDSVRQTSSARPASSAEVSAPQSPVVPVAGGT